MASILIVDDHGLFAGTMAMALRARGSVVRVVQPTRHMDVSAAIGEQDTDLVLLDLDLGDTRDATELIDELTKTFDAPIVMVTGVQDPVRRARCVAAGAVGVIDKAGSFDELLGGIDRVLEAGTLLTRYEREVYLSTLRAHEHEERARLAPFAQLTPREAEVLGELMHGRSVQQIASASGVSLATVRTQIRAIRDKLDVGSQVAAIGRARAAGWVPPQECDTAQD